MKFKLNLDFKTIYTHKIIEEPEVLEINDWRSPLKNKIPKYQYAYHTHAQKRVGKRQEEIFKAMNKSPLYIRHDILTKFVHQ